MGLQIRLFGELEVVRDGRALPLPASKKTRALLAYLVATARPALRERLCELLWDGPDDPRAQLRWSLTKLRPLVDDATSTRLQADRERVGFLATEVEIDLYAVRARLGVQPREAPLDALTDAAARMRGELLEGLDLPGCYRYHAWCAGEREAARALRVTVLSALVERLRAQPEAALGWARTLVTVDPLSELAHTKVVTLLGELGRTKEALRQVDECRRLLDAEGVGKPTGELERARLALSTPPPASPTPPSLRAEARGPSSALPSRRAPLVGRAAELQAVRAAIAQRAGVLLLVGDPGIGKSRVLDEVALRVRLDGGRVLAGSAFEAERIRPYGAWIDALRAIPPGEIAEVLRPDLSALLPELGAAPLSGGDRNRLFDAVAQLLRSTQSAKQTTAVILDDVHWLDEASAALLHFIARSDGAPLFACAARPGELADNPPVWRLLRALAREGRLVEHRVAPLSPAETAELVRPLAPSLDAARVFTESAGNPLFALEVGRALAAGGETSDTLDGLIGDRLAQLDDRARELVPWAAALGRSFGPELLGRASGISSTDLLSAVEELERRGVLRAQTDGRYDFVHDLVRQAAYRQLSSPRRRLVHAAIARALGAAPDPDGALAGDRAHHAALAGELHDAARACVAAGQRCVRLFANEEAAALALRGLSLVEGLPRPTRLELELALYDVWVSSLDWRRAESDLERRLARTVLDAQEAGLVAEVQRALFLLSIVHYYAGSFAAAADDALRAVEAGRGTDDKTFAISLGHSARCLVLLERNLPHAEQLIRESEAVCARIGASIVDVPWTLGMLGHFDGRLDEAVVSLDAAVSLSRREQDHWSTCLALLELAQIELERTRPLVARAYAASVLPIAERLGEGSEAPFAEALAALAALQLDEPQAGAQLTRSFASLRAIDARGLYAYAANAWAELSLERGQYADAAKRAADAVEQAGSVERRSEVVVARALLARASFALGDRKGARSQVEQLLPDLTRARTISARATNAAHNALKAIGISIPTVAPT